MLLFIKEISPQKFVLRKYFLTKLNICSTHQKKCFSKLIFCKIIWIRQALIQKWWKFVINFRLIFGNIFCEQNYLNSTRKYQFVPINRRSLTKMVKICIISICAKKIFFAKGICSTRTYKEVFLHNFTHFWKIELLKEYRQAIFGPYKNGENLYYLNLC